MSISNQVSHGRSSGPRKVAKGKKVVNQAVAAGRKMKVTDLPDPKEFAKSKYKPHPKNPPDKVFAENPLGLPWNFTDVVTAWLDYRRSDWDWVMFEPRFGFLEPPPSVWDKEENASRLRVFIAQSNVQWTLDRLNEMRRAVDELEQVLKVEAMAHARRAREEAEEANLQVKEPPKQLAKQRPS
jgi:hypothetical protein